MNITHSLGRFASEVARALRNFKYEMTGTGIYLPASRASIGGVFRNAFAPVGIVDQHGNPMFGPWAVDPNRVVTEGLVYILNAALAGSSQLSTYYLAPFGADVTPAAGWTAANFDTNATEFTAYTSVGRLPWTPAAATSTPSVGNSASLVAATMTFSAGGPYDVYGVGLLSNGTKESTAGKLIAATAFATAREDMVAGDKLALEYIFTAADAS